jgi:hypothetical protein
MSSKYALIIANTEYTDPNLAQLSAPGKDAEEFARVLKDKEIGAFDDVKVLLNHPDSTAREAIDEFFDQKKQDDLLLLYFSGHGVRDEVGALYLAAKNTTRARLRSTAIRSDFIREAMDQSRSKRIILILDCCNSGAFAQGTKAITGGNVGTASAFEGTGYGRIVLTASDSTQFAWEGDKVIGETQNSLFTHFLIQGMDGEADHDGDGRITVDELFDYAYEQIVTRTPKQTPGKWSYKQQGEIVLRQSTRMENIKPVSLPDELMEATEDSRTFVREGAVKQLEKLLSGKNLGLARSAREALEKISAEDDSRHVQQIAMQALGVIYQSEQKTEPLVEEQISQEIKHGVTQKTEDVRTSPEIEDTKRDINKKQRRSETQNINEENQHIAGSKVKEKIISQEKNDSINKTITLLTSLLKNKRIIIPIAIALFLCVIIFAVFPAVTKSDISSTPISPGISSIQIPSFAAGEDVYVKFDRDQKFLSQNFETRWFFEMNILGAELYIPTGYMKYTVAIGDTSVFFNLKNPGVAGKYRVDIYMNQELVGTKTFQIIPR